MTTNVAPKLTRRNFSAGCVLALGMRSAVCDEPVTSSWDLTGAIGIVSASAHAQTTGRAKGRKFTLLEMPKILKEELDIALLDLNTMSFPSLDKVNGVYIDQLRNAADKAGCVLSNLKMNQRGLELGSTDRDTRGKAIKAYKRAINIASELGCRWARPLPSQTAPNMAFYVAGYQELCDYAADRNVQLLIENFGWMQNDPQSITKLMKQIGHNVAACPDTGNWQNNDVRYEGLKHTFPLAVTCDFKAKKLTPEAEHAAYDLKRCFDIGWNAGFRGPWAIEHGNSDTAAFIAEIGIIRDLLKKWIAER